MRLSREAHKRRAEIEEACQFSPDDLGIAKFYHVPLYEVQAIRLVLPDRIAQQEEVRRSEEELGSRALNEAIQALFRSWERKHGFQKGAAEKLVPAGYHPEVEA